MPLLSTTPKKTTTIEMTTTTTITTATQRTTTTAPTMTMEPLPEDQAALRSNTSGHVNIAKEEATQKLETPTSPKQGSDTSAVAAAKLRTATVSPELTESNAAQQLRSTIAVSTGRLQDPVTPTGWKIICSLRYSVVFSLGF